MMKRERRRPRWENKERIQSVCCGGGGGVINWQKLWPVEYSGFLFSLSDNCFYSQVENDILQRWALVLFLALLR